MTAERCENLPGIRDILEFLFGPGSFWVPGPGGRKFPWPITLKLFIILK